MLKKKVFIYIEVFGVGNKLNAICCDVIIMLHCGLRRGLKCAYEADSLPLSKLRVRGSVHVHFTKWNVLQNGSLDSPEGMCLGKFPSACLKVEWNAALVFAIICDAQIASSLFDRYKGIYNSLKHNSSSAIYINRLVMTETKLLKTLNQLNQLNHCLKKI